MRKRCAGDGRRCGGGCLGNIGVQSQWLVSHYPKCSLTVMTKMQKVVEIRHWLCKMQRGQKKQERKEKKKRNSKAKQDATQRRATDSNGGKSREASLVLELHRASTCYSRAEQQMQWQAMDEAGQIGGREGKEKKSCEDKRTEGGESTG